MWSIWYETASTVIKTNRIPPLISTRILVFSVTMVVASFVLNHSEQQLAWANDEGGCLFSHGLHHHADRVCNRCGVADALEAAAAPVKNR